MQAQQGIPGTGASGIEAISRGAKTVHLIDKNKDAIKIIKENLKGIEGNFKVFNADFLEFLNSANCKYDLIFLDPPYKTDYGIIAIENIVKLNLLNKEGIIIFETSEDREFSFPSCFEFIKKKYGTVAVYKLIYKE